jgi:hypothetical protein
MSARSFFVCVAIVVTIGCSPNGNTESPAALAVAAVTVPDTDEPKTLFTNVQVFDGVNDARSAVDVLVQGNLIKQVGAGIDAPGATVIDGGGGTLMPGMIENHAHLMLMGPTLNPNFAARNECIEVTQPWLGHCRPDVLERRFG